ncbi:ESX secretion-associated protein EspG [Nocardia sp. CWNU-33]|uniref:ESX secretion-associated protein EspG n=1 Tax=Nocardia sp. CWNU-33 TaxID=3392117 RepID=UPI00398F3EAA
MKTDPVAIDLNVDAALLLQDMVGIDSYPPVLALMPNVFKLEDRERVRAVIRPQLIEVGAIEDDRVHPTIEHWLQCLYRPDMELLARIVDTGLDGDERGMLRFSLVRCGDTHVLAVRCDDHIVIQSVFLEEEDLDGVTAALAAALGHRPMLSFEPFRATLQDLDEVPFDQDERRRALVELGAQPHTAGVLSRVLFEVVRRAEILMIEHRDGGSTQTEVCVSVLDTQSGRFMVTPSKAMDGEIWSTYAPGDESGLRAGIGALIELLPGRSWFETSRVG